MMPSDGKRTPLAGIIAGAQDIAARFGEVFGITRLFSPGQPLVPAEPEKVRLWGFPVGYNLVYTPRAWEPIGFAQLRTLAESHDITRLAIETRKDQIERLDWRIVPRGPDATVAGADTRIACLTEFWRHPDGEQPFATWLREALEDVLVIDAPSFEIRRNRGGQIIGLDVVDGATIKVLIDDTGRRPMPPAPAYEQIIHGRPWRLLTSDELLYLPRNKRPHKVYGFSPVEQIVMTVNIALRRQVMQLQHFTEGNIPVGLVSAPDKWTQPQVAEFQQWFDSVLAGNTAERTKLIWGPAGTKYQPFKEPPYKDDFDEWLARIVCYAFSLPPTAFVRQVNRATADTAQEAALSEGLGPLLSWVKRLADTVIQRRMGHADLEFVWADEKPVDALEQAQVLQIYIKEGIKTRNEARDILGDDPMAGGDALMVDTGQGPVLLADISAPPAPAPGLCIDGPSPAITERTSEGTDRAQPLVAPARDRPGTEGQTNRLRHSPKVGSFDTVAAVSSGVIDPANAERVPLPVADADTRAEVDHRAWQWIQDGHPLPPAETVPIGKLRATQDDVDRDRVAAHAAIWRETGAYARPPIALAVNGLYYVIGGHHRVAGALAAGADAIPVTAIPGDREQ